MKTRTTLVMRIILALSLGIAFLAMNTVGTLTADADINSVKRNTVTIGMKVDRAIYGRDYVWFGSGWIHSDNVTVITAAHVLGAASDLLTEKPGMEYVVVKPYGSSGKLRVNEIMVASSTSDTGILTLQSSYNAPGSSLFLHDSGPDQGWTVTAVGTPGRGGPLGPEGTTRSGKVTAVSVRHFPDVFKFSGKIEGGMSGGPVISAQSFTVVGVNSASASHKETGKFMYSLAVKSRYVVNLINRRADAADVIVSTRIPTDRSDPVFLAGVGTALSVAGATDLAQRYARQLSTQGSRAARLLKALRKLLRIF